mgnify:CR=1 FL=1
MSRDPLVRFLNRGRSRLVPGALACLVTLSLAVEPAFAQGPPAEQEEQPPEGEDGRGRSRPSEQALGSLRGADERHGPVSFHATWRPASGRDAPPYERAPPSRARLRDKHRRQDIDRATTHPGRVVHASDVIRSASGSRGEALRPAPGASGALDRTDVAHPVDRPCRRELVLLFEPYGVGLPRPDAHLDGGILDQGARAEERLPRGIAQRL